MSDEKSILYKPYWGVKQSNEASLTANLSNPGILKADDDVSNKLSQNSRKINKLGHNNELNPKENKLSTAQSDQVTQPRRRRLRKRKRKKQRRLKNKLEVTTVKTDLPKNLTLDDLIQKINENPEVNLNSLESEAFNKTLTYHAETNKTENRYINLTLDLGRTSRRCRMRKGGCSQICRAKGVPKCACYHGYTLDKDMRTCLGEFKIAVFWLVLFLGVTHLQVFKGNWLSCILKYVSCRYWWVQDEQWWLSIDLHEQSGFVRVFLQWRLQIGGRR